MQTTLNNIVVKELKTSSSEVRKSQDIEGLKMLKIELDTILGDINYQIDKYNCEYTQKLISGNYDWLVKAKRKKRLYGAVSQLIQNRIGFLRSKEKQQKQDSFLNIFFEKVKENIDEELFSKLVDEAILECTK